MNEIRISNRLISETSPVFIIAEAGVNHNGSISQAKELVDAAAESGVDCVKFQTFRAGNLVTKKAKKAEYQLKVTDNNESQFDMLKKLELSLNDYQELKEYCFKRNIIFLSTPYNKEDVDFLKTINVEGFKIASGQIVETSFIEYIAGQGKPVIISTGMSYLSDVDKAVRILRKNIGENFVLLHCVTNYPASSSESNVKAMVTMKHSFNCLVGYSDHTRNNLSALTSVALGARVVEKHFTLDKNMPGPDHSCSADFTEMVSLVKEIREVEAILGDGLKVPSDSEKKNASGMRRSLVAAENINKGEVLSEKNIGVKRPEGGLSPDFYEVVLGKIVKEDIRADTLLTLNMISWK